MFEQECNPLSSEVRFPDGDNGVLHTSHGNTRANMDL